MSENPDVAVSGIDKNLPGPGGSDGYAADSERLMSSDSDCLMSSEFFENQNLMYDACDEYSQTSVEFTEETAMMTAVMDKEVAGLKALLTALKEREK